MTLENLQKAPFPWFGGKRHAAPAVWAALGDVDHYVEPFCGTMAVLLERPHPCNRPYFSETVNDADGLLVNAWRSIAFSPDETAFHASWPVSEADKSARQIALLRWRDEVALDHLAGDPEWHDPKMGGWWLWAVCVQIGAFAGDGAWTADRVTGRIIKQPRAPREPGVVRNRPELVGGGRGVNRPQLREPGVSRDLPHLTSDGQGVNRPQLREPGVRRNRPLLVSNGNGVNHPGTREPGVSRDLPHLSCNGRGVNHAGTREPGVVRNRPHLGNDGQGVNHAGTREPGVVRGLPHLGNDGKGVNRPQLREPGVLDGMGEFHPICMPELKRWFAWLSARIRHVRIVNGDWKRVMTTGAAHTLTVRQGGVCGFFIDPPYDNAVRAGGLYAHDCGSVAAEAREWCLKNGDNPKNRIVLAGYDVEHGELEAAGWTSVEWFTTGFLRGGMAQVGGDGHQQARERLWLSPHCLRPTVAAHQLDMFAAQETLL